jgi:hypothetical protein
MNKKSAFSVAEMLITMSIIGIIFVVGYHTLAHIDNKSIKYTYSNVYHSLDKAFYNGMMASDLKNPFDNKEFDDSGTEVDVPEAEQTTRLCKMLALYIQGGSSCGAEPVSISGANFPGAHLTALNGVQFYISKKYPAAGEEDDDNHAFFIIFADMNGPTKGPNSMNYVLNANGVPDPSPDIFAFAALDIGRICPLGIPEYDTRYMQTRISYLDKAENVSQVEAGSVVDNLGGGAKIGENNEGDYNVFDAVVVTRKFSKESKPYYVSKAEAWGYGTPDFDNDFIIDANPLTYNHYIQEKVLEIDPESKIYAFLNNPNFSYSLEGITFKGNSPENGGYGCLLGSDFECDVIIDKFIY